MSIRKGTVVRHRNAAEWGPGVVLGQTGADTDLFFLAGGRRRVRGDALAPTAGRPEERELLALAAALPEQKWARAKHHVYVIALADSVRGDAAFRERNATMQPDLPCYYVGLTGHPPEKRLSQHLRGYKYNRYVKASGPEQARLCPQRYAHFNPLPFEFGERFEPWLAETLRKRGHGVWQG
jgi:hypothetical protein